MFFLKGLASSPGGRRPPHPPPAPVGEQFEATPHTMMSSKQGAAHRVIKLAQGVERKSWVIGLNLKWCQPQHVQWNLASNARKYLIPILTVIFLEDLEIWSNLFYQSLGSSVLPKLEVWSSDTSVDNKPGPGHKLLPRQCVQHATLCLAKYGAQHWMTETTSPFAMQGPLHLRGLWVSPCLPDQSWEPTWSPKWNNPRAKPVETNPT